MTKEQIIRMARDAALQDEHGWDGISCRDQTIKWQDIKIAELEAKLQQVNSLCELNEQTMSDIASKYEALDAQNAALLVAIEAKQKALKMVEWEEYDDPDWGMQVFCPSCRMEKKHGHYECRLAEALTISPSTELLEARDRVRDAKLLRVVLNKADWSPNQLVYANGYIEDLAKQRESGEWQLELGE